mmetsp:Transcript_49070/g.113709  ORF Transcript_49070/g.113709 Transcript_49070/m.113709 type:complete len:259 (+) Transcript_49070:116-892(+)
MDHRVEEQSHNLPHLSHLCVLMLLSYHHLVQLFCPCQSFTSPRRCQVLNLSLLGADNKRQSLQLLRLAPQASHSCPCSVQLSLQNSYGSNQLCLPALHSCNRIAQLLRLCRLRDLGVSQLLYLWQQLPLGGLCLALQQLYPFFMTTRNLMRLFLQMSKSSRHQVCLRLHLVHPCPLTGIQLLHAFLQLACGGPHPRCLIFQLCRSYCVTAHHLVQRILQIPESCLHLVLLLAHLYLQLLGACLLGGLQLLHLRLHLAL